MKKLFTLFLTLGLFLCSWAQTVTYQDILDQKSAKELTGKVG